MLQMPVKAHALIAMAHVAEVQSSIDGLGASGF
jgi:hypothetical protein